MPLFGEPDVSQLQSKGDVKGLTKALKYKKETRVRSGAAKALGELRDRRAVGPLIEATRDPHWFVVESAATALGEIGDPAAADRLNELLEYESAPRADLGRVDPRLAGYSSPAISAGLASYESEDVRKAARAALDKLEMGGSAG